MHISMLLMISILHEATCIPDSPVPQIYNMSLHCLGDRDYRSKARVPEFLYHTLSFHNMDAEEEKVCEMTFESPASNNEWFKFKLYTDLSGIQGLCSFVWFYVDYSVSALCGNVSSIVGEHIRVVAHYPNPVIIKDLVITALYETHRECAVNAYIRAEKCCHFSYGKEKVNEEYKNKLALCDTHRCISRDLLCDGVPNCEDRSDEEGWYWCSKWPVAVGVAVALPLPIAAVVVGIKKWRAKAKNTNGIH